MPVRGSGSKPSKPLFSTVDVGVHTLAVRHKAVISHLTLTGNFL